MPHNPRFAVGSTVTINEPSNAYNGSSATVKDVATFPGFAVYTVEIPTGTGNGAVSFAIRENFLS